MPAPSTTLPSLSAQARNWITGNLIPAVRTAAGRVHRRWRAWCAGARTPGIRRARRLAGLAAAVAASALSAVAAGGLIGAIVAEAVRDARWLGRSPVGQAAHQLGATVGRPVGAWLHQHAAGLPASPAVLGWSWLLLAAVLYLSALRGSLAGRLALAALAAGTVAAAWQAGPADTRPVASAVTAGAWLLLVPSAYARTERPAREDDLDDSGASAPTVIVVVQQFTTAAAGPVPDRHTAPQPNGKTTEQLPAAGFACRWCSAALVWDGPAGSVRTWRSAGDGGTYCPQAPELDIELDIAGHAHHAL
ncbi:hypothetical protein ACFVUY_38060 [Kitasatospora sp. NPDC058063]|uniref:hypothetical protein n=1 Tax=unclassified Kitasatospora TaxID=2633591 RepID=UPI0036DA27FA